MKILWVSHFVPWPPKGGNLQRSYHLIRSLSQEADIDLIAFHRRASLANSDLKGAEKALREVCRDVEIFPIPNERSRVAFVSGLARNLFQKLPYTVMELRSAPFLKRIRERLEAGSYDAVHFDTIDLAEYRTHAEGIPSVLNHHNIESLLFRTRAPREKNALAGLYLKLQSKKLERFETKWYEQFERNLFVSESDRKRVETLCPTVTTEVIPNGVDISYYTPGREGGKKHLVWVGGLGWFPNRDGVAYLVDTIWPRIRERHPDAVLDLIGSAPARLRPRGASADGVRFHGFVDDLRPLVERAWLSLVPLRIGSGTRLKILDAMAMGKCVVSTSIGCEGIEATHGREIFVADTTDSFVEEVDTLLGDRERREAAGAGARALAETLYSWNVIGENFLRLYRGLIESTGGVCLSGKED